MSVAMEASTSVMKHALEFLIELHSTVSSASLRLYMNLRWIFSYISKELLGYGANVSRTFWKASCTQAVIAGLKCSKLTYKISFFFFPA